MAEVVNAMPPEAEPSVTRISWIADNLTTGGIGTVCQYAAEGFAAFSGWRATVVSLRPSPSDRIDPATGVRYVALGLKENAAQAFLRWLGENPQQFIITNDVPQIEAAFPHVPQSTCHVIAIHDSLRRHLDVAVRNCHTVDGVVAVAKHIEDLLRPRLAGENYHGLLETVHNGAAFPPPPVRTTYSGPLRLLFLGSLDPFKKGILDLVPILQATRKLNIPVRLTIAGGGHELLERRFKEERLSSLVTWTGWVSHDECYRLAAESDVLLMPSRKEAFGMVTIEAMSMGCVPLAYDVVSGSREIIQSGRSGLLIPLGDIRAWSYALKSLYEKRDWWELLSQGAMDRARMNFDAEAMAANLRSFLRRVEGHAQICPPERKSGLPPELQVASEAATSHYQRLSPGIRRWVRNRIGASPRISHWLLNRW